LIPFTVKGKKGKSTKKESTPATAPAAEPAHPFVNFSIEDLNPYTAFEHLHPAASPSLATPCFKAFGVSPWSPPPHARRMRGDIIYLTVTTLEGDSFHITGSTSGFWISKMTSHSFDPLPKAVQPAGLRHTPYHSLFELFSALSPGFVKGLSKLIESQNSAPASADIYASLAIMNAIPAAPWLIPAPVHTSDPFRTQIAFLLTSTTNADLLPPARDWNDELAQYKELPQKTLPEKLVRERLLHRVNADFVNAATRGALSIARGDVPPLNPNEPQEAHTYIYNQMLFTRADDAINAWEHAGGNEASRVAASKDLAGVNILERLDIGGIHTMATAIIDYCGDRWVAQSLIPGLFKTKELDEEVKKGEVEETDVVVYPAGDAEAIKTAAEALANDKPFPSDATVNKDDYPPTGVFRIVYGSSNPEAPDENIRSSSYFHQIAGKVAQEVKLAEHTVVASDGKSTSLWTSTDMHGIAAPDGRSYFIDCCESPSVLSLPWTSN
jgi:protein TIF31